MLRLLRSPLVEFSIGIKKMVPPREGRKPPKPQIWKRNRFLYFLVSSLLHALTRAAIGWCIKVYYGVLDMVYGSRGRFTPPYLKEGMTSSYFTAIFRQHGYISSSNEVIHVEWKSVQPGAVGSVYRVTFIYKDPPFITRPSSSASINNIHPKLYGRVTNSRAPRTAIIKCCGDKVLQVLFANVVGIMEVEKSGVELLSQYAPDSVPTIYGTVPNVYIYIKYMMLEDILN
jgi:hypothetical protein